MLSDPQRIFYNQSGPPIHLLYSAQRAFRRAWITQNIDEALLLQEVKEDLKGNFRGSTMDLDMKLTRVQGSLYDHIIDDMLVIGAFELYAKAVLGGQGVLVHAIRTPSSLKKDQGKRPVKVAEAEAEDAVLRMQSIKCSTLLEDAYCDLIGVPAQHRESLEGINKCRNLIHGHPIIGHRFERDTFLAIKWLGDAIEATIEQVRARIAAIEDGGQ